MAGAGERGRGDAVQGLGRRPALAARLTRSYAAARLRRTLKDAAPAEIRPGLAIIQDRINQENLRKESSWN
jgi:hypothetical protein